MAKKKAEFLADSEIKPHGNAKDIDWEVLDALLLTDPTKVYCCNYLNCSDTHMDNQVKAKFGLTFTEYKELRLQDVVTSIKASMIKEAQSGDVSAGKYVLSNIGDWKDKSEVKNDTTNKNIEITYEEYLKTLESN